MVPPYFSVHTVVVRGTPPGVSTLKRTAIYLRVSTDRQNVEMQRDAVAQVIMPEELQEAVEYVDDGVSAVRVKMKDRRNLRQLTADVSNGLIDKVVTYSRDRVARDPYEWIRFWRICNAYGVRITFAMQGHPPVTDNVTLEMIYAQFSADEGRKIGERARQGTYFSPRKLIGYAVEVGVEDGKRTYTVDPETAPLIKECFESATRSTSIDEFLCVLGHFSGQLHITKERLIQCLQDERYTGTVLGRDGTPRFPQIVDPDLYARLGGLYAQFTIQVQQTTGTKLVVPSCGLCAPPTPMELNSLGLSPDWVCRRHRSVSVPVQNLNEHAKAVVHQVMMQLDPDKIREVALKEIDRVVRKLKRRVSNVSYEIEYLALQLSFGSRRGKKYHDGAVRLQQYHQDLSELNGDIQELLKHRADLQSASQSKKEFVASGRLTESSMTTLAQIILQDVVVYPHSIQIVVAHSDLWHVDLQSTEA